MQTGNNFLTDKTKQRTVYLYSIPYPLNSKNTKFVNKLLVNKLIYETKDVVNNFA